MMSDAFTAQSHPIISRKADAWIALLTLQAGLSAAAATGAIGGPIATHDRQASRGAYCDPILPGTGGSASPEYFEANNYFGYRIPSIGTRGASVAPVQELTTAQKLERVLSILKPNVTELAGAFGVSRQAIYGWKSGEPISQSNVDRLDDLNEAADVFAGTGLTEPGRLLRRKFDSGKNLFDIVRDGGSASAAAKTLIELVRREDAQRRALDARLKARIAPSIQLDDIGMPMMSERS